jgi:hypothetical protein
LCVPGIRAAEVSLGTGTPKAKVGGGLNGAILTDANDRQAILDAMKEALKMAFENSKTANYAQTVKDLITKQLHDDEGLTVTDWESEPVKIQ